MKLLNDCKAFGSDYNSYICIRGFVEATEVYCFSICVRTSAENIHRAIGVSCIKSEPKYILLEFFIDYYLLIRREDYGFKLQLSSAGNHSIFSANYLFKNLNCDLQLMLILVTFQLSLWPGLDTTRSPRMKRQKQSASCLFFSFNG